MKSQGPLLPQPKHVPEIRGDGRAEASQPVVSTCEHAVIQRWAASRRAEPATGEATASGPATLEVNDSGAGVRFNFPGAARFRPISWEEWFENFDRHELTFVYDNEDSSSSYAHEPPSNRYQIVKKADWKGMIG
jgi:hypothetical protein